MVDLKLPPGNIDVVKQINRNAILNYVKKLTTFLILKH